MGHADDYANGDAVVDAGVGADVDASVHDAELVIAKVADVYLIRSLLARGQAEAEIVVVGTTAMLLERSTQVDSGWNSRCSRTVQEQAVRNALEASNKIYRTLKPNVGRSPLLLSLLLLLRSLLRLRWSLRRLSHCHQMNSLTIIFD